MSRDNDYTPNILFLDIEGVMTRGMFGAVSLVRYFHAGSDGNYSQLATALVRNLVRNHGFRIVLITRHGRNESNVLNRRLAAAGIETDWFYKPDPDAIPDDWETKGDSVQAWFRRNPSVPIHATVAVEDEPRRLDGYPPERIVAPDPRRGLQHCDFKKILALIGAAGITPAPPATGPQALQVR